MHECTLTDVLLKWSEGTTEVICMCADDPFVSISKEIQTFKVLKSTWPFLLSNPFLCFTIQLTQCNILCKHQVSWATQLPLESNMSSLSAAVCGLCRVIEALKQWWGCTVVTIWAHLLFCFVLFFRMGKGCLYLFSLVGYFCLYLNTFVHDIELK